MENNVLYTLESTYKSDVRLCNKVFSPLTSVENRLGHLDAIIEWTNIEEACAKFLNTEAYRTFIKNDYILLIGRTGTGKTTILNRYKYEIENNTNPDIDFKYVLNIDFKPYLIQLIQCGNIENSETGLYELQNNIIMLINLEIMRMIYSKTDFIHKDFKSSSLLRASLLNALFGGENAICVKYRYAWNQLDLASAFFECGRKDEGYATLEESVQSFSEWFSISENTELQFVGLFDTLTVKRVGNKESVLRFLIGENQSRGLQCIACEEKFLALSEKLMKAI